MICVPVLLGRLVANYFGVWWGVGSGTLSTVLCATLLTLLYRAKRRRQESKRRGLREKYRGIYRVLSVPSEAKNVIKAPGNEIIVGDYGWESEPPKNKGDLVFLQGLDENWRVVWYAGFSAQQIEYIGPKPRSQYDWDSSWFKAPPRCPFAIRSRKTTSMGLPNIWGSNGPRRL